MCRRGQASVHLQSLDSFLWDEITFLVCLFFFSPTFIGSGMGGTTRLKQYLPPNHCFSLLHQYQSVKVSFSVETLR